ncbi:hypothetical protein ACMSDU_07960 [Bacteroides thetaiotaomicron]|jgi:hypothetical protein|uniref:Uncharacterized protein n=1 Tax=Bacteroides stercoris TaxID=46506 RepID=A0A3E4UQD2_BACSE|nr:hypothetical protein [Bacteroides stercoris]RGM13999.1 hypothetical protein DXC34_06885 [Bacteroides stercoris]
MTFYEINRSYDPNVTGVRNGRSPFLINEKKTFISKEAKERYDKYNKSIDTDINKLFLNEFTPINSVEVSEIEVFPISKRVKLTDWMQVSPREIGFTFLFSKKLVNLIDSYRMPQYNKLTTKIAGHTNDYFLVGFPIIDESFINFENTIFYDDIHKKKIQFSTYEDYKVFFEMNTFIQPTDIYLNKKINYDIIRIRSRYFFSEYLISEMEKSNILGYEKLSGVLHN